LEYDSSSSECDPTSTARGGPTAAAAATAAHSSRAGYPFVSTGSSSPSDIDAQEYRGTTGYSHIYPEHAYSKRPRKVRRKLGPREREQVHQLRKIGACTKCWGLKMKVGAALSYERAYMADLPPKCDNGSPCKRCEKAAAGALCVRVHFVDLDVFSKCRFLLPGYAPHISTRQFRNDDEPRLTFCVCQGWWTPIRVP